MAIEFTSGAVLYMIIAVAVIVVGITYISGTNVLSLFSGQKLSSTEIISVSTEVDKDGLSCSNDRYEAELSINLAYSGPPKDIRLMPILDIGNNPVVPTDEKYVIECEYDADNKKHDCDPGTDIKFILYPQNAKTTEFLRGPALAQLLLFSENEDIQGYAKSSLRKHTTSNLQQEFTDFFKTSATVGIFSTACFASAAPHDCNQYDNKMICDDMNTEGCFWDDNIIFSDYCRECSSLYLVNDFNDCAAYILEAACNKCVLKDGGKCQYNNGNCIALGTSP